jgi:membrane protein required for colicin V production
MILDIIGIAFIVLFFIRGYMKGIIVAAFSLIGVILGIICALKFSHSLARYFFQKGIITSGSGQFVSYLIIFIGIVLLVRMAAKAIETFLKAILLGMVNKITGGVLYAFIAALTWSVVLWISNQMHLITPETIAESKTYTYFAQLAPWVMEHIAKLWPFAKNLFADLEKFFIEVNKKLPQHVGADR